MRFNHADWGRSLLLLLLPCRHHQHHQNHHHHRRHRQRSRKHTFALHAFAIARIVARAQDPQHTFTQTPRMWGGDAHARAVHAHSTALTRNTTTATTLSGTRAHTKNDTMPARSVRQPRWTSVDIWPKGTRAGCVCVCVSFASESSSRVSVCSANTQARASLCVYTFTAHLCAALYVAYTRGSTVEKLWYCTA